MNTSLEPLPRGHRSLDPSALVRHAADGDPMAWQELVRRYADLLWSVTRSFRLSDEDAADVVQNTWLRLSVYVGGIQFPDALPGWLATTARNECRQLLRGRRERATALEDLDRPSDEPGPAEHAISREVTDILRAAMIRLPEREGHLLRLLMESSRPGYAEIAAALGMAVGSIGPTRSRALNKLRGELASSAITDRCW